MPYRKTNHWTANGSKTKKEDILLWFCFIFTPVEKYQKNQNDICHEHINI